MDWKIKLYEFCVINLNLNYRNQRFTPSGFKDIGIRKFEVVIKTQFLWYSHAW